MQENNKKYFLATTALEEFWDHTKPLLFLGEWCLPYKKKGLLNNGKNIVISDQWIDDKKLLMAQNYVNSIYKLIFPQLAEKLNKVHNKNYSSRFWEIFIGYWLYAYIGIIYERYINISEILKKYNNVTTVLLNEDSFIIPQSHDEFFDVLVVDDFYNLQIYSKILLFLGKIFPKKAMEYKNTNVNTARFFLKKNLFCLYNVIMRMLRWNGKVITSGIPLPKRYYPWILLRGKTKVIPLLRAQYFPLHKVIDWEKRSHLKNFSGLKSRFEAFISESIFFDIPKNFVENFSDIESIFTRYCKDVKAVLWTRAEDYLRCYLAKLVENHVVLVGVQHGGNYGVLQYHSSERFELLVNDYYCTWGWQRNSCNAKTVRLPICKLLFLKEQRKHYVIQKNKVLFAVSNFLRYLNDLMPSSRTSSILRVFEWQRKFFENLKDEIKSLTKVRFRPEDGGWEVLERLKDFVPEANLELGIWRSRGKGSFLHSLKDSRIYVGDHLATTYAEALALNTPTVLFWDPNDYHFTDEATDCFNELRECGILYHDPLAAAAAVNSVYYDVEDWWNNDRVQKARKNFCNRFALITDDMRLDRWLKDVVKLVNVSY